MAEDGCANQLNNAEVPFATGGIEPPPRALADGGPSATPQTSDATSAQADDDKSKRRRLLVVLLLAIVAGLCFWFLNRPTDNWYDGGMTIGSYDGKPEDDIVADLNAQVAENEMNVSCAPIIAVDAETGEAAVRVENIAANHVDQKFTIALEDGTVLYESGGVAPGSHVQTVKIGEVPDPGEYDCTVTFQGYDPETHAPKGGSAALVVKMIVS